MSGNTFQQSASAALSSAADQEQEISYVRRKLHAWQPALSPMTAAVSVAGAGALFLSLGIAILAAAYSTIEVSVDYTDGVHRGAHGTGWFQMTIPQDMEPPILMQYEIQGISQSNLLYQRSRSDAQLRSEDEPILSPVHGDLKTCHPRISQSDTGNLSRILYPCGLVARSIFNDTFVLRASESQGSVAETLELDQSLASLMPGDGLGYRQLDPESVVDGRALQARLHMWLTAIFPPTTCEQIDFSVPFEPIEVASRYESSPEGKILVVDCWDYSSASPQCNFLKSGQPFNCSKTHRAVPRREWGIESGHFAAWMQTSSVGGTLGAVVRKPWAVIRKPLLEGTIVNVSFVDRYPVEAFQGRKLVVLSTEPRFGSLVLGSSQGAQIFGWLHLGLGLGASFLGVWYSLSIWHHGLDLGHGPNYLDRFSCGRS